MPFICYRPGMPNNWTKMSPILADEAAALYASGFSLAETAAVFGVTRQSMWAVLRRRGVAMRQNVKAGAENHFYRGGSRIVARAHDICEKAIIRGILVRPSRCEECGKAPRKMRNGASAIQAHHDNYAKPLAVRWLCQPCHHEWHKHNVAEGA